MKNVFPLLLIACFASYADTGNDPLADRVSALEARVEKLETRLANVLEQERVKELAQSHREQARERILHEGDLYPHQDLEMIDRLFETVAKDPGSEDAGKATRLLLARYPAANSTGCALLLRAQAEVGQVQIADLKSAIEKYGACYYGNGVQVGPYAKLYLAMRHIKDGNRKEAEKLFTDIRKNHSDAIDHKGQLLTLHIDQLQRAN